MIKAVKLTLGLVLLVAAFSVCAQTNPSQLAEEEAVRRQEATIVLHKKLLAAQDAQRKGFLADAGKFYQEAVSLFGKVGVGSPEVEAEKQQAVTGLVDVRLQLARDAQQHGNLVEANEQVSSALKVDPRNETLLAFKRENDKMILAKRGTVPSDEVLATVPDIQKEKIAAATLVQDGKLLYEMGKFDEASVKLNLALKKDPTNPAANYYLSLIKEANYKVLSSTREQVAKAAIIEVTDAMVPPIKRDSIQLPGRTNYAHTSKGRQSIKSKLDRIRFPEVVFEGLPLGEVLKSLRDESKRRDPDQVGINFLFNPHVNATAAAPLVNPNDASAAVFAPAPAAAVDLNSVTVHLNPALTDVRLADVLDAIVQVSDQPIQYEIQEYAIIFSPKAPEAVSLYTRTFKVNPNTFQQGLESVSSLSLSISTGGSGGSGGGQGGGGGGQGGQGGGQGGQGGQNGGGSGLSIPRVSVSGGSGNQGGGGQGGQGGGAAGSGGLSHVSVTNNMANVNTMVRDYFTAAGVDFGPVGLPNGKSVFFNDRTGLLLVRASLQDLEIIQSAIETLNADPPQVTIEAKFTEIKQSDSKALGFDWYLGNSTFNNGKIGYQAGTAPSFQGNSTANNPNGSFPNPTIAQSATDTLLTSGLTGNGSIPALGTITGILTDPQFRLVIRALESRTGTDLMAAPKVTTLSGRQTQISVTDVQTIVTGVDLNQQSSGGSGNNNNNNNNSGGGTSVGSTVQYITQVLPFGPVLDVIPYVSSDGYSIQMTIIPTVTEFLGYDDPGAFVPKAQSVGGANVGLPLTAQLPLPHMRLRQVTTSCNVWDGQTVMLGGLIAESTTKVKEKIPMLGDLPFLGRFFRSESSSSDKRNLMIFVTPTIIDPAGNRVHPDDSMSFARVSIPAQPANASVIAQPGTTVGPK